MLSGWFCIGMQVEEFLQLLVCFLPQTEQAAVTAQHPAVFRQGLPKAPNKASCWRAVFTASVGRRDHLMSGLRRTTPDAVHGTSAKTASNCFPSYHAAKSRASAQYREAV